MIKFDYDFLEKDGHEVDLNQANVQNPKERYIRQACEAATNALNHVRDVVVKVQVDYIEINILVPVTLSNEDFKKQTSEIVSILEKTYFTKQEHDAITELIGYAVSFESGIDPQGNLKLLLFILLDDKALFYHATSQRNWDLALDIVKNDKILENPRMKDFCFQLLLYKNTKRCPQAQELLSLIVKAVPSYYKEVKEYLNAKFRKELEYLESTL